MDVVVDNSAGGDSRFAEDVARRLQAAGLAAELRRPSRSAMFDTAVHVVSTGLVIRVSERPDRPRMSVIETAVREALMRRPGMRGRARSVPVQLGETARVLSWIDVIE